MPQTTTSSATLSAERNSTFEPSTRDSFNITARAASTNQTRRFLERRPSVTGRRADNRARYAASSSPFSFGFSIRCHRGFCPAELSFIALDAAFESKPARLRHVISVRYEVFPKTWNVCGKFLEIGRAHV